MSFVGKAIGSLTGANKAADSAQQGAQISADAQREALNYLKQTEAVPQELRESALTQLGGLFGLGGDSAGALSALKNSAAYQNILGSRQSGEQAILRNASATGGLRSGNANDALARFTGDLEMSAFNAGLQGLQGLAQLPSNANNIAQMTGNIGNTLAQGRIAAGQAQQSGFGALLGAGTNLAAGIYSDARLKTNVKPAGERNGFPWYTWEWNDEAASLGLFGNDEGHMAHEVMQSRPDAISLKGDYLTVNYKELEN